MKILNIKNRIMENVKSKCINRIVSLCFFYTTLLGIAQPDFQSNLGYVPHFRHVRDVEIYQDHLFAIGGWENNDSIASIFQSSDDGNNWNFVTDNINAILEDIDFYGNSGRIVGWSGNYWKSEDAGLSWVSHPMTGNLSNRDFFDSYWFSSMVGIAVGGKIIGLDTLSTIARTTDGGESWATVFESPGSRLKSIDFYGSSNGITAGEDGLVLRSSDGGITWQNDASISLNRDWESVKINPQNQVTLIIGGESATDSLSSILRSVDEGVSWEIIQDNPGSKYFGLDWITGSKAMVVGKDGVKKWSDDGGLTWVDLNLINDNDIQWNVVRFLNPGYAFMGGEFGKVTFLSDPANGNIQKEVDDLIFYFDNYSSNLTFRNPPSTEFHLKLYDVLGKQLFVNSTINSSGMIDYSFLSPGQYLVDFELGGKHLNYKFIKP
jgi:photosystem II stability/assembly factor-like uncharacterized protein